jgi:hypothetical protein
MSSLTERDEAKLLDGVKLAASLVANEGYSPTDAMVKAAKKFGYTPGFLRIACNAFNTGCQNSQWSSADSVLDKLASVPLVNYDAVHEVLWGENKSGTKVKQASYEPAVPTYEDMFRAVKTPAVFKVKAASTAEASQPDGPTMSSKLRNLNPLRRAMETAAVEKTAAQARFNLHLHQLCQYFQKPPEMRASFTAIKSAAVSRHGQHCDILFDYVSDRTAAVARGKNAYHQKLAVDWSREPFCFVDRLIKAGSELNTATAQHQDAEAKYNTEYETLLSPRPTKPEPASNPKLAEVDLGLFKLSGILGGMLSAGAFGATRSTLEGLRNAEDKKLDGYVSSLDSPLHRDQLRNIKTQALLAEFMSDPDNPISGYDPDVVLREFNNIVQMTPRSADQPAVISSLLNKRLAGNVEPFELAETLNLEKGLKDTQMPVGSAAGGYSAGL